MSILQPVGGCASKEKEKKEKWFYVTISEQRACPSLQITRLSVVQLTKEIERSCRSLTRATAALRNRGVTEINKSAELEYRATDKTVLVIPL